MENNIVQLNIQSYNSIVIENTKLRALLDSLLENAKLDEKNCDKPQLLFDNNTINNSLEVLFRKRYYDTISERVEEL